MAGRPEEPLTVRRWFQRWRGRNEDVPIRGVRERVFAYTAEARQATAPLSRHLAT